MASFPIPPGEIKRLDGVLEAVRSGQTVEMTGLYGASGALVLSALMVPKAPFFAMLAPDERHGWALKEDLEFFLKRSVPLYPAAEAHVDGGAEARTILSERMALLSALSPAPAFPCLVVPVSGLLAAVPSREALSAHALTFEPGMSLDLQDVTARLREAGLRPTPMVTAPAEFSLRGDILDIYPMAFERPVRLELFDVVVESIREIDLETQRSRSPLKGITIPLPGTKKDSGWTTLQGHLPEDTVITLFEPHQVAQRLSRQSREFEGATAKAEEARQLAFDTPGIHLHRIATGRAGALEYAVHPARGTGRLLKDIRPSLEALARDARTVKILCQNEAEGARLQEVMIDQGIPPGPGLQIEIGRISEGFKIPSWGCCYLNHHELLMRLPVRRERKARKIKARALESFTELKEKDLVVHLVHGIARYEGITRMDREGGKEDFLKLVFDGDTLLYLPAAKIHLVEKYIGGEGHAPKLDRLGGKGFQRRKERVQEALEDLAADLLELQAVRDEERGTAFGSDDDLSILFEASFPYQDTDDQVRALEEIKGDMEKAKPMDRLLCGDVGFGKTELAIRAAFKAVNCGKQAAMLVPTTILAQQHFETFQTRLADYPLTVEVLSRFRRRAEQKGIVEAVKAGKVDILIGTHRLLSSDVGFKDLGLLIIDEEQRFGVVHKERLKRMKRTVDVLTMTATPIPRTLHMAMVGLRDISSLESAPEGRIAIHTQVLYKSNEAIKKAILIEQNRGGQVYYLHNRVETIARETRFLRELVPSARIAFAHGQMAERELERVMFHFIRGEIDVLVCTTIIESGIDLPRVNTILIDRADTFGLADLHQLRGRVGRGSVQARALLLIPPRPLPEVALRRLKAIEELSRLGSGFQIALKDLEIRGAGNILGAEQHGHIAAVGYDLFCRLLRKTILQKKGLAVEEDMSDVDLDIRVNAYLPAAYIPDSGLRMEFLKKLGGLQDPEGIRALRDELRDRFGRLPVTAECLLDVCLVRSRMVKCGIRRIAHVAREPYLLVLLADEERYGRDQPFRSEEMRFLEPSKAHLHPPGGVRDPGETLNFLKSRLMPLDKNL